MVQINLRPARRRDRPQSVVLRVDPAPRAPRSPRRPRRQPGRPFCGQPARDGGAGHPVLCRWGGTEAAGRGFWGCFLAVPGGAAARRTRRRPARHWAHAPAPWTQPTHPPLLPQAPPWSRPAARASAPSASSTPSPAPSTRSSATCSSTLPRWWCGSWRRKSRGSSRRPRCARGRRPSCAPSTACATASSSWTRAQRRRGGRGRCSLQTGRARRVRASTPRRTRAPTSGPCSRSPPPPAPRAPTWGPWSPPARPSTPRWRPRAAARGSPPISAPRRPPTSTARPTLASPRPASGLAGRPRRGSTS